MEKLDLFKQLQFSPTLTHSTWNYVLHKITTNNITIATWTSNGFFHFYNTLDVSSQKNKVHLVELNSYYKLEKVEWSNHLADNNGAFVSYHSCSCPVFLCFGLIQAKKKKLSQ